MAMQAERPIVCGGMSADLIRPGRGGELTEVPYTEGFASTRLNEVLKPVGTTGFTTADLRAILLEGVAAG